MGIGFSHPNSFETSAHWSYDGFNHFRIRLAAMIGYELDRMSGFGRKESWNSVTDPIKPLLDHSDCEGELTATECATVGPRLRELVASWSNDDYDKINALRLADGMAECVESNKPLIFR